MKKKQSTKTAKLTAKPRNNKLEASLLKRLKSDKFLYVLGFWVGLTIILLLFTSCAPFEPVPGLCYTDKTGTYLCPKDCKEEDKTYHGHCITPAPTVNNPEGLRATSQKRTL